MRLQEKAKQVGFEWDNKDQVWEKVEEEIGELKAAISNLQQAEKKDIPVKAALQQDVEDEMGDVFFSLINFARFLQVDAENALERTNKKFIDRFTKMETEALKQGKNLHDLNLEEMDAIWNLVKKENR
jgi:XTP/dITP diphosphohydrolase